MGLLDLNAADLELTALNTRVPVAPKDPTGPDISKNLLPGAGQFFMRSMAEAGRGLSMAAGAVPVALQAAVDHLDPGGRINDKRLDDSYFKWHDEVFGNAVDYWTPKPGEVGAAGEVIGSLAGGLTQFLANPALAVTTAQMSTAEDLVRKGVEPGAALVAGDLAGLGTVAGIALPIAGKNLWQRLATGVAGNLGQSVAQAGATQAVLGAAKAPKEVVAQFDPWDTRGRTVDALMGLAFGTMAHVGARKLTQAQTEAVSVLASARHAEESATPGRPSGADLTVAVDAHRKAMDQMLRGEPVDVGSELIRFEHDPSKAAERAEIARILDDFLPKGEPIARPEMAANDIAASPPKQHATAQQARQTFAEFKVSDEGLPQFFDRTNPPPEIRNLMIGLNEGHQPDKMLADFTRASETQPSRSPIDVSADVVDAARAGQPTTPEPAPMPKPMFDESLRVPTGEIDSAGNPASISANEHVAAAQAELAASKTTGRGLFLTAAECLLGAI